jgi:dienelactone hydrolase
MSKSCCPEDSEPFLAEDPSYTPAGSMIKIGAIDAYTVGAGSTCILFIHDIFGLNSGLNKIVCDHLVKIMPGVMVVAPDFFPSGNMMGDDPLVERGHGALSWKVFWKIASCKICGFIQKYSWENSSEDICNATMSHMMANNGCTKFVMLGFCWGAYVGFKACNYAEHKAAIIGMIPVRFVFIL